MLVSCKALYYKTRKLEAWLCNANFLQCFLQCFLLEAWLHNTGFLQSIPNSSKAQVSLQIMSAAFGAGLVYSLRSES